MTDKPSWAELLQELDQAIAELKEASIELELLTNKPLAEANEVILKAMEQ